MSLVPLASRPIPCSSAQKYIIASFWPGELQFLSSQFCIIQSNMALANGSVICPCLPDTFPHLLQSKGVRRWKLGDEVMMENIGSINLFPRDLLFPPGM